MSPFHPTIQKALSDPDSLTMEEAEYARPFFRDHHPMLAAIAKHLDEPCMCLLCRPLFARPPGPARTSPALVLVAASAY